MARGALPTPPLPLIPKVSFQKIEDDVSTQPCGVHDGQARAFGYNNFSEFQRPDAYIRHIEPLESELAKQVEYDMDEQDKEWLDTLNVERRKDQLSKISYELFEIVMDRLEKEWFDLTKNIPKPDFALPSEDSTCAICDDSEGENSNAIVFCDGCNLAVHQDCYGVPYIPEGQWLCRKCTVSPENPVSCFLCPNEGGAFKQTNTGAWVHLLCAIWIPETGVTNETFMEPVVGVDSLDQRRWSLPCAVCDPHAKKNSTVRGACIQCAKGLCPVAYHVTCARKQRLLLPMKAAQGATATLTCYCEKHLPKEYQDTRAAALAAEDALQDNPGHNAKMVKSARAYAKTYKPGPPLVPAVVVDRIDFYIRRFKLSKRIPTLQMMCRYWSLKREARRGAPLLKRLHLEPWTASAGGKVQTDVEKVMKLDQLNHLLFDLEGLKDLTFTTKKRERWKLEQVRAICDVLDNSLFVHERRLRAAFDKVVTMDRQEYFKNPVSKTEVPDYHDIIDKPMCWVTIEEKLNRHEYWDVAAFKGDIDLVVHNALQYNKAGTPFHKAALRIQTAATPILEDLRLQSNVDESIDGGTAETPNGTLEPPLELLELLMSPEALQDEMDLVLEDSPLASMFAFALPKMKPPPPPPTPPPPAVKAKRGRKKKKQAADPAHGVTTNPLRIALKPRTRGAAAAVAVSEGPVDETIEDPAGVGEEDALEDATEGTEDPMDVSMQESIQTEINETPLAGISISTAPAKRDRTRAARPSRILNDSLPLVDDVDNRSSFKLFNAGWILPPEQKRGGRSSISQPAPIVAPRPRKRQRTDAGTSRLSVLSAVAAESQALLGTPESAQASPSVQPTPSTKNQPPAESPIADPPLPTTKSPFPSVDALLLIPGRDTAGPQIDETGARDLPTSTDVEIRASGLPSPMVHSNHGTPDPAVHDLISATAGVSLSEEEGSGGSRPVLIEPEHDESEPMAIDQQESSTASGTYTNDVPAMAVPDTVEEQGQEPQTADQAPVDDDAAEDDDDATVSMSSPSEEPPSIPLSIGRGRREPVASSSVDRRISDLPPVPLSLGRSRRFSNAPPPLSSTRLMHGERVIEENGRKVLETLDTPEMRKIKAREKKMQLERRKLQATQQQLAESTSTVTQPGSGVFVNTSASAIVSGSALAPPLSSSQSAQGESSRSFADATGLEPGVSHSSEVDRGDLLARASAPVSALSLSSASAKKRIRVGRAPHTAPEAIAESDHVLVKEGTVLEGGTIVWAQAKSYPWWPAVIWDYKDFNVPLNIKKEHEKAFQKRGTEMYVVQFFDKHKSWQILPNDALRMLGEDEELDRDMLADKSKRQKIRWTEKSKAECRNSYEIAMKEMETPSDLERGTMNVLAIDQASREAAVPQSGQEATVTVAGADGESEVEDGDTAVGHGLTVS